MSEREDNVYKAKLAEQAERYDGEHILDKITLRWSRDNTLESGHSDGPFDETSSCNYHPCFNL